MTCDQCGGSFTRGSSSCTTCGSPKTASARSILGDDDTMAVQRHRDEYEADNRLAYFCRGIGVFIAFVAMDAAEFQHMLAGTTVAIFVFFAPDILRKLS